MLSLLKTTPARRDVTNQNGTGPITRLIMRNFHDLLLLVVFLEQGLRQLSLVIQTLPTIIYDNSMLTLVIVLHKDTITPNPHGGESTTEKASSN